MREFIDLVETELTARLDEVEIGGDVTGDFPDSVDSKDLASNQLDLFEPVSPAEPTLPRNGHWKIAGRMKDYWVATRKYDDGEPPTYVWIRAGSAVAYLQAKSYSYKNLLYPSVEMANKPDLHGRGYRIGAVYVRPEFRGSNLAPDMYVWFLENVCDYLMADSMQTVGGVKLWKRLHRDPRLAVEVWDGERYKSRNRRAGKDFDRVYDTMTLVPWVTLKDRLYRVLWGEEDE